MGAWLYGEYMLYKLGLVGGSEALSAFHSLQTCPAMATDLLLFCICASIGQASCPLYTRMYNRICVLAILHTACILVSIVCHTMPYIP